MERTRRYRVLLALGVALVVGPPGPPHAGAAVLAVGSAYTESSADASVKCAPFVWRWEDDAWRPGTLPVTAVCDTLGVTFSTADTAWIYGSNGSGGLLLKSMDGGRTWTDATNKLPSELQSGFASGLRLVTVGFRDARTGWLLAKGVLGESYAVTATYDGGGQWQSLRPFGTGPFAGDYRVLTVRGRTIGLSLASHDTPIDDLADETLPRGARARLSMDTRAVTVAAGRVFLAGAVVDAQPDRYRSTPAVASWEPGAAAALPPVRLPTEGTLTSVTAFSDTAIAACGSVGAMDAQRAPACFASTDAGLHWTKADLAAVSEGAVMNAATAISATQGFLVQTDGSGSTLFRSDDAGLHWQPAPSPIAGRWIIRGFASSAAIAAQEGAPQ